MEDAHRIISFGLRQDPQEKGYPYYEEHFTHEPVLVKSPGHRKQLMKRFGLREYRTNRLIGRPGQWV